MKFVCSAAIFLCACFPRTNTVDPTTDDAGVVGYGQPTLEVTAGGLRAGPAAPDSSSAASLVNERDERGRITRSTFSLFGALSQSGVSCALTVSRYGTDVSSVNIGFYQIATATGVATPDGTVSPDGVPTVVS